MRLSAPRKRIPVWDGCNELVLWLRLDARYCEEERVHILPRVESWWDVYYFTRYHSVAAVYEKSVLREVITEHMQGMGFKPVTFTQYARTKQRAVT